MTEEIIEKAAEGTEVIAKEGNNGFIWNYNKARIRR